MTSKIRVVLALATAGGVSGCAVKECNCPIGTEGVPRVTLGPQAGPAAVTATFPNQCEIDLDFGSLGAGQTSTAVVQVDNVGASELDVAQFSGALNGGFALVDAGLQPAIEPGSFAPYTISFSPSTVGSASASFELETDGNNQTCPNPSMVTVKLAGASG